jgi:hypothetical protein
VKYGKFVLVAVLFIVTALLVFGYFGVKYLNSSTTHQPLFLFVPLNITLTSFTIYPENITSSWAINASSEVGMKSLEYVIKNNGTIMMGTESFIDAPWYNQPLYPGDTFVLVFKSVRPLANNASVYIQVNLMDGTAGCLMINEHQRVEAQT